MDVQLQELIDKIKKEGVAQAESKSAEIIAAAEQKAAKIISDAEEKASNVIKSAKSETERMEKASVDAIKQAGRNLIISFRDGVNAELSALVSSETAKAYNADMLKTLIPETVKAWASKSEVSDISVLLSKKDASTLSSEFSALLKSEISKGLVIKTDDALSSGFRIGVKDGSAYYDFSAESVADLFSTYLNPRTSQIMKDAAEEIKAERN